MKEDKKYMEFYKSKEWKGKVKQILNRDLHICQICRNSDNVSVYPKYYIYHILPWNYPDELLISLCSDCHSHWYKNKYIIYDFAKILLVHGYTVPTLIALSSRLLKLPPGIGGLFLIDSVIESYEEERKAYDAAIEEVMNKEDEAPPFA